MDIQHKITTKFHPKKEKALFLSDIYKKIGLNDKALKIRNCGDFLEFSQSRNSEFKLTNANFCKARLCPMCAWRRSLKIYGQVSKILNSLKDNGDYRYLFLTLTLKNCIPEDLKDTLDLLMSAWNSFSRKKAFKQVVKGFYRALEITFNSDSGECHPHFHCILLVDKSYFNQSRVYLSKRDWEDMWKLSLKVSYRPIVDVRAFKTTSDKTIEKSVAEGAKYTIKDNDYLFEDNELESIRRVKILEESLLSRRLISMGGKFKELHKKLNLDDPENGDLIDENQVIIKDIKTMIRYGWNGTGYTKSFSGVCHE